MARRTKKTIFIFILLFISSAAAVSFYLYNKGPVDVQNSSGIAVDATNLYNLYIRDTLTAKKKFAEKVLEVDGEISETFLNSNEQRVVLLKTGVSGAAINCTLEAPSADIKPADKIIIKGICNGIGEADTELGITGDVYLARCYLLKKY